MKIAIFTTGGTIDKVYFDAKGNYHVGAPMVRELLDHARLGEIPDIIELLRKDSLEMTDADRQVIRAAVAGIDGKTIVLTGALQPGRFADKDAAVNLGLAFGAVQLCSAGVYVVANGQVFPADKVRKNLELNRFEAL